MIQALWELEPASVREVLGKLNQQREELYAYTTVLRFLQIMTEKGLVSRRKGERGHIYEASVPAERTKRQMAYDLMERVFKGSAHDMVLHALGGRRVSSDELMEIRKMVENLDMEGKES